jgi:hypothetical protein
MKTYWDSSALVEALQDEGLRKELSSGDHVTRVHSLAEVFSTITGGRLSFRVDADEAADMIDELAGDLSFVELTDAEVRKSLRSAQGLGVRGGHVHDYLHAVAATKAGCGKLRTINVGHFRGLEEGWEIEG